MLITLHKIARHLAGRTLFSELSLGVNDRERLAVLGANGAGKSTLLKLLAGLDAPDEGTVTCRRGLAVSYVPQLDEFPADATVYSALSAALPHDDPQREARIAICMGRAGFTEKDVPVAGLSGGQKKRLAIARGLIVEAELLLLDEPTNHLDIEGIEWLEELVKSLPCAAVFVSHDRYFIDAVASRVVEIDKRYPGGILASEGGYSAFLTYRADFLQQLQQYRESLGNRVRREVEWLRQGAKARTTKSKYRTAEAERMIAELKSLHFGSRRAELVFTGTDKHLEQSRLAAPIAADDSDSATRSKRER